MRRDLRSYLDQMCSYVIEKSRDKDDAFTKKVALGKIFNHFPWAEITIRRMIYGRSASPLARYLEKHFGLGLTVYKSMNNNSRKAIDGVKIARIGNEHDISEGFVSYAEKKKRFIGAGHLQNLEADALARVALFDEQTKDGYRLPQFIFDLIQGIGGTFEQHMARKELALVNEDVRRLGAVKDQRIAELEQQLAVKNSDEPSISDLKKESVEIEETEKEKVKAAEGNI